MAAVTSAVPPPQIRYCCCSYRLFAASYSCASRSNGFLFGSNASFHDGCPAAGVADDTARHKAVTTLGPDEPRGHIRAQGAACESLSICESQHDDRRTSSESQVSSERQYLKG